MFVKKSVLQRPLKLSGISKNIYSLMPTCAVTTYARANKKKKILK